MGKGQATENDCLKMILMGIDPSYRTGTTIYAALYNADPSNNVITTTFETAYTNYNRVAIVKATGWSGGTGSTFYNGGVITFPQCGVTGDIITHIGLVSTASGTGQIFYSGALANPLTIVNLIQPQFPIGSLVITES